MPAEVKGRRTDDPPQTKAKTPARPSWGLVRTYTARALGGRGLESARHLLTLSRNVFGICIK